MKHEYTDIILDMKVIEPKQPKKRGISNQKHHIACAVDEKGKCVIEVSVPGRITSKE